MFAGAFMRARKRYFIDTFRKEAHSGKCFATFVAACDRNARDDAIN
jgi:hypothetical protein